MHGWIILDKPSGITSAHVVAKVKRLLHPKKIGHAGTLDPLASGVLPLALGEATKTVPYMMDAGKAYCFTVTWGEERDTDDIQGRVTQTNSKHPSKAEIEAILDQFRGTILQTPPSYSAIKVNGERAYAMARQGQEVELKAREVIVKSLEFVIPSEAEGSPFGAAKKDPSTPLRFAQDDQQSDSSSFICHCGKGTYIRSIARDMGRVLGCFGHVSALRRLRVGKFDESTAISLETLEEIVHKGGLGFLHPVESALDDILALDVDTNQAARLTRGQPVMLPQGDWKNGSIMARHNGRLVAICEQSQDAIRPVRVFNID